MDITNTLGLVSRSCGLGMEVCEGGIINIQSLTFSWSPALDTI